MYQNVLTAVITPLRR